MPRLSNAVWLIAGVLFIAWLLVQLGVITIG